MAQRALDVDKILLAIDELRRWERRAAELADAKATRTSVDELARARQQVAYYGGLLQDMKRRANPDSAPRLMRRFR